VTPAAEDIVDGLMPFGEGGGVSRAQTPQRLARSEASHARVGIAV
jgi:hypothetical protein